MPESQRKLENKVSNILETEKNKSLEKITDYGFLFALQSYLEQRSIFKKFRDLALEQVQMKKWKKKLHWGICAD